VQQLLRRRYLMNHQGRGGGEGGQFEQVVSAMFGNKIAGNEKVEIPHENKAMEKHYCHRCKAVGRLMKDFRINLARDKGNKKEL
jgi:hypothetical protein